LNNAHWLKSRNIVERIIIQGDLILETPAGFGSGDKEDLIDIPLLLDPLEGKSLLTGASLAGALRSYLRERECGYGEIGDKKSLYLNLFGRQEDGEGEQSLLIVHDSLGDKSTVELRDGVKIDPITRTAVAKHKFDFELLEAGTCFKIRMELLVQKKRRDELVRGLAIALQGLEMCEINLGIRKRRGFGKCRVKEWEVCHYNLTEPEGLIGWLKIDPCKIDPIVVETGSSISALLNATDTDLDKRNIFTLDATFSLNGSLLIGSGFDDVNAPDSVHLKSKRGGQAVPILSGTSLAGALRARALRIANNCKNGNAEIWVNKLFGSPLKSLQDKNSSDQNTASKLITAETEIINPVDLVQSRLKIDRFTGGAYPGALFHEQPVFGLDTGINIHILIQQPEDAQIGMLLLLLKDLWTGDLPLGGESSVGRGRLHGESATLTFRSTDPEHWTINQANNELDIDGDMAKLEGFVNKFQEEMTV
jgi:CRISPR/Cas system CSM-associated protein Csm3 (group 7 of RAMP superfamily)